MAKFDWNTFCNYVAFLTGEMASGTRHPHHDSELISWYHDAFLPWDHYLNNIVLFAHDSPITRSHFMDPTDRAIKGFYCIYSVLPGGCVTVISLQGVADSGPDACFTKMRNPHFMKVAMLISQIVNIKFFTCPISTAVGAYTKFMMKWLMRLKIQKNISVQNLVANLMKLCGTGPMAVLSLHRNSMWHICSLVYTQESGGCFTNLSQALQNNLTRIYNARNHIYGENCKLKIIIIGWK